MTLSSGKPYKIWIIEDDENMQFVYRDIFSSQYELLFFASIESFVQGIALHQPPHLLILDLVFPDGLLYQAFPQHAPAFRQVPFIVVSALDEEEAVRASLKWGALDYITKPFGKSEILVKVEAHLNRCANKDDYQAIFNLDPLTLTIFNHSGRSAELTSKEFRIMSLFLDAHEYRISRKDIFETLWKNIRVSTKTLDVHLSNIRRKIEPLKLTITVTDSDYRIFEHDGSHFI